MPGDAPEKRDWRVSAVLLAVWVVALVIIGGRRDDIPLSMIAMATLFFVILIPAMNDLVRSLEKRIGGDAGDDKGS
jgi:hypothetical protein